MSYPDYRKVYHHTTTPVSTSTMTNLDEDSYHHGDDNNNSSSNNGDSSFNFFEHWWNDNHNNQHHTGISSSSNNNHNNHPHNSFNSSFAASTTFVEEFSNNNVEYNQLEEEGFSHLVDKMVTNDITEDAVTTTTTNATLNQPPLTYSASAAPQPRSLSNAANNIDMKQSATITPPVFSTINPHIMTTSSPEDLDRLLAHDLTKLSFRDREQAMNDLHGIVTKPPQEQPEQRNALLQQLQQHLDAMHWLPEASAYRRAVQTNPSFVRWKRLMFLRAEQYQPQEAATRLLRFFTMKLELWGPDKLCRTIRLDDLSPDDYYALQLGISSISPYKDTAGRSIFCVEPSLYRQQIKDRNCFLRANWYVYMSTVEDNTDAQIRGIVFVALNIPPQYRATGMSMRDTVPVKFCALHAHFLMGDDNTNNNNDGNGNRKVVPFVMIQCVKEQSLQKRVRYRSYTGSRMEAVYEMMRFGIPVEAVPPLGKDGQPTNSRHLEWIEKRRQLEAQQQQQEQQHDALKKNIVQDGSTPSSISSSTSLNASAGSTSSSSGSGIILESNLRLDDVLFGKEKRVVNHPGNTRFRQLIDMYLASYESAPRGEKTRITKAIVEHIHSSSGRFLKRGPPATVGASSDEVNTNINKGNATTLPDGFGWVEVDTETAYDKITHAFRNRRKHLQKSKF